MTNNQENNKAQQKNKINKKIQINKTKKQLINNQKYYKSVKSNI